MLTARQKAAILAKAGIAVPDFPVRRDPRPQNQQQQQSSHDSLQISLAEREIDAEHASAVTRWNHAIDMLHAAYATARAARSLREAR